jgi:DNA (cytosine-5)-methyltransferase 1
MACDPRPIGIDLFSGAGGLSLGFEQAGFDIVASVEYDPVHAATHEFNFPHTQAICGSVATLSAAALREAARNGLRWHGRDAQAWDGRPDVVFGGPPCQGFSFIGKRLIDDPRNELVFHFLRIVSELRPRYFVMENVPGMARGGQAGILKQLVQDFGVAGYRVVQPHNILNAADFGVPQDRKRLFLIGASKGEPLPTYPVSSVRPVPKRLAGKANVSEESSRMGPTVWDAIGDLPDINRFPELRHNDTVRLSDTQVARLDSSASTYVRRLRDLELDPDDFSYKRKWDRSLLTGSARTEHTDVSIARFRATAGGTTEPISRFYRLDPAGLCNTLRAGSGSERGAFTSPRPIHPFSPRVLSNREAARLHSFPDWFRVHTTKWHGFRQIGNSVAPLVGRAIGARIVAALNIAPSRPATAIELGNIGLLEFTMSQATEHFGADKNEIPAQRTRKVVEIADRRARKRPRVPTPVR